MATPLEAEDMAKRVQPYNRHVARKLTRAAPNQDRIKSNKECERRFRALVALVDAKSVPTASKFLYKKWLPTI